MKKLVAYFSASGVTAGVAKTLAETARADLYEIKPQTPYSDADLNWMDRNSRSSIEMNNMAFRPQIDGKLDGLDDYDVIFVGFPIWWYTAPTIIYTFLESYDFSGKTIVPFATSGGSGFGKIDETLRALCPDTINWKPGKVLKSNSSKDTLGDWISDLGM